MTEERYTLGDAETLLGRWECHQKGHQLTSVRAYAVDVHTGRVPALQRVRAIMAPEGGYICERCDVTVTLTYPPLGAKAGAYGGVILTDLDITPDFDNVAFASGEGVHTFVRMRTSLSNGWAREGRDDQICSWSAVVAAAKGAPIRAWNDGEWARGEAKP